MKFATLFLGGCWLAAWLAWPVSGRTAESAPELTAAERDGQQLARQLGNACPDKNLTNAATLTIRAKKRTLEIPVSFQITVLDPATGRWEARYETGGTNAEVVIIQHVAGQAAHYRGLTNGQAVDLPATAVSLPFAGSDFWLGDLGLDFLHWPAQKILPKTTNLKRGREYKLLESTNPHPPTNGYSRVLSWIDKETGGILEAEAYDVNGKLLKDFAPKEFSKVNGQWELQEMQMINVQTGSRTRLEFDLKK